MVQPKKAATAWSWFGMPKIIARSESVDTKYFPVSTVDDGEELSRLEPWGLLKVSPRLCIDFPKEAESPTVYWIHKRRLSVISSVCGWIKVWLSPAQR